MRTMQFGLGIKEKGFNDMVDQRLREISKTQQRFGKETGKKVQRAEKADETERDTDMSCPGK